MSDQKNKLRYEDLEENCKALQNRLDKANTTIDELDKMIALKNNISLREINLLQAKIILLQQQIIDGVK